jgi:hypothetical protein
MSIDDDTCKVTKAAIQAGLDCIDASLGRLADLLDRLGSRLEPVRGNIPSDTATSPSAYFGDSPHAVRLAGCVSYLATLTQRIEEYLAELEV